MQRIRVVGIHDSSCILHIFLRHQMARIEILWHKLRELLTCPFRDRILKLGVAGERAWIVSQKTRPHGQIGLLGLFVFGVKGAAFADLGEMVDPRAG